MEPSEVLAQVNQIRAKYGKTKMTYRTDKISCANKEAAYNAVHGAHKCGIDGVCKCGYKAAGDFNANDLVDAIVRAYATRNTEGNGTCDDKSHCGALLEYDSIVVGYYASTHYYAVIQYF